MKIPGNSKYWTVLAELVFHTISEMHRPTSTLCSQSALISFHGRIRCLCCKW